MVLRIFDYLDLVFDQRYMGGTESLDDISKVLKYHNVCTMVISVPDIATTPLLFPALIQSKNKIFYVLEGKNPDGFKMYDLKNDKHNNITFVEFYQSFTGDILLLQKVEGLSKGINKRLKPITTFLSNHFVSFFGISVFTFLIVYILHPNISWIVISLYLLNGAGLILSGAYLLQAKGINNIAFNLFCIVNKDKSSCEMGNNSIYSPLLFSQLGANYFILNIAGFFLLGVLQSRSSFTLIHYYLGILSMLMVCISLYIQCLKNKEICRLCMMINFILIIHAYLIMTNSALISMEINVNVGHIILGLITSVTIMMFSINLTLKIEKNKFIIKNNQIWSNKFVIDRFLIENNDIILPKRSSLILGNKRGKIKLVLIMHLSCIYCEDAFRQLAYLVVMNEEVILQLFIKYDNTPYHQKMMFRFIEACQSNQINAAINVFSEWKKEKYEDEILASRDISDSIYIRDNHRFFNKNKLTSYPIILINGKKVPGFIDFVYIKVAYS